jgi:hypothetical protein
LDLKADGYDVDFVGSQVAGQNAVPSFDPNNEGHPGWHADGDSEGRNIAPNIYNWLNVNPADIILLHIGTNDISSGQNPALVAAEIGQILDNIDQYETYNGVNVWVILSHIISRTDSMAPATTALNNQIQLMADARIAGGDNIIVVDMENDAGLIYSIDQSAPYGDGDMYDLIHPNASGYEKMAVKWLDALLTILPQADAGDDQSVNESTLVTLDGSGSFDPDGASLNYLWEQIPQVPPGTSVTLSDQTAEKPTFTAPEVKLSGERLEFKLTVTDADGFQNSDTVLVDLNDVLLPPVANAGADQTVAPGTKVTLNGSNSYDPDGMITSVQWEQISGKAQVTLTTPNDLTTDFMAPEVDADGDVQMFRLTVKDNDDLVSEGTVTIAITPPRVISATDNSAGGSGGGGCFIQSVMN